MNLTLTSSKATTHFGSIVTTKTAALAGILGPVLFTLGTTLSDILNYPFLVATANDPFTTSPVSVNALGPYGWIQMATFATFGLLLLVFAAGLYRAVQADKWFTLSIGLLMMVGLAMVLLAAPCDCEFKGQAPASTLAGTIHNLAFSLFMLSQLGMYFFMWPYLRQDARWRGYDRYSLATCVLALPLFFGLMSLAPVFPWFYLWLLVVPLAWIEVVAIRLWAVSQPAEVRPTSVTDTPAKAIH